MIHATLTTREAGIVYLITCGWESRRISEYFHVGCQAIRNNLTEIHRKTGTRNSASLAYWWVRNVLKVDDVRCLSDGKILAQLCLIKNPSPDVAGMILYLARRISSA